MERIAVIPTSAMATIASFLDEVRDALHYPQLSYRTEETYLHTIRRFIAFHDKRHPKNMGAEEVRRYLIHLDP